MKPNITVIVPIYNTEKHIDKCLASIRNQTMQEIEIICVDDCSPDDSYLIVEKHIEEDPRITLLHHKKNMGLGGARNTAIRAARSDYIASVDSDDYIHPNMMERLWAETEEGKYDIVCCGFDNVDEEGSLLSRQAPPYKEIVNINNSINIFSNVSPSFCNKLWRKSLYTENNIFFPVREYYEDMATTPRILAKSKYIKIIEDSLYYYYARSNSITNSYSSRHLLDYFKVFEIILDFLNENKLIERYRDDFLEYVDRGTTYHSRSVVDSNMEKKELDQYLRHFLMLKVAFFQLYEFINSKDQKELLFFLENAKSQRDLM